MPFSPFPLGFFWIFCHLNIAWKFLVLWVEYINRIAEKLHHKRNEPVFFPYFIRFSLNFFVITSGYSSFDLHALHIQILFKICVYLKSHASNKSWLSFALYIVYLISIERNVFDGPSLYFFFLRSHDSLHFHVPIFKLNCTLLWMELSKRTVEERDEKWIASGIGPKTQKMSYKNAGNICLNCICIVAFSTEFLSSVKHLFKLFYSFIHFRWCRFSLCPVFVLFSLGMFHINNQLLEVESNEIKKRYNKTILVSGKAWDLALFSHIYNPHCACIPFDIAWIAQTMLKMHKIHQIYT